MINLGTVKPGKTIRIPFSSFDKDDGSSITMTNYAVADILIYKDGSTTERASTAGFTATTDFDTKTGKHLIIIDLADNTTADFFAAGSEYLVAIDAVTVDAVTTGGWVARFEIGYVGALLDTTIATLSSQTSFTLTIGPAEDDALNGHWAIIHDAASAVQFSRVIISDYTGSTKTVTLAAGATFTAAAKDNFSVMGVAPLQPTVANRTLDVSTGGEAGVDWANVGTQGSTVALTATTIATTQKVDIETIKTQTVATTGAGTITIPAAATLASTTNITAGVITTTTNLTNMPAIPADWITSTGLHASAVTEIQTGLATEAELAKVPKSDSNVTWNATAAAQIQTEANDALVANNLDHLLLSAVDTNFATTVHLDSVIGHLADNGTTATFSRSTDSLESLRDRGDAAWITATGFSTHSAADVVTAMGTGTFLTAIPWNASWDAEVQSEVQDAIEVNHLDHLLAADYDPASKPGVATALLNEIVGNDAGVSQFTANALELAPTGGSAPTASQIADEVQTRTIAAVTTVNGLADNVITAASIAADAITDAKVASDVTIASVTGSVGSVTAGVTLANGAHGGAATTITFERMIGLSTTTNQPAVKFTGNGTGSGMDLISGATGYGFCATGYEYGIKAQGTNGGGMSLVGVGAPGMNIQCQNTDALWIHATVIGDGIHISGTGDDSHGIRVIGGSGGVSDGINVTAGNGGIGVRTDTVTISGAITATNASNDIRGIQVNDFTTAAKAILQTEANDALIANNLDHLILSAVDTNFATTVHLNSVIGQLADNGTTATFDRTTDSLEAARDRGDAAWTTATGFSTHSAADVWTAGTRTLTAFGFTVTTSNAADVTAILADTNELQTDWANGGRLDLILDARASQTSVDDLPTNAELATALGTADDAVLAAISTLQTSVNTLDDYVDTEVAAIKAKTDLITTFPANFSSLGINASGHISRVTLVDTTTTNTDLVSAASIATAVLTTQLTEAYAADGVAPTLTQAMFLIQQAFTEFVISGTSILIKKIDGSTTAATYTMDSSSVPTQRLRTS